MTCQANATIIQWINNNVDEFFRIKIGNYITQRGIAAADITQVNFVVKASINDTDANARVSQELTGSALDDALEGTGADTTLKMSFSASDFGVGKLEVNGTYIMGIAFMTGSTTEKLEDIITENIRIIPSRFS